MLVCGRSKRHPPRVWFISQYNCPLWTALGTAQGRDEPRFEELKQLSTAGRHSGDTRPARRDEVCPVRRGAIPGGFWEEEARVVPNV